MVQISWWKQRNSTFKRVLSWTQLVYIANFEETASSYPMKIFVSKHSGSDSWNIYSQFAQILKSGEFNVQGQGRGRQADD
jgi:hypothetical protein